MGGCSSHQIQAAERTGLLEATVAIAAAYVWDKLTWQALDEESGAKQQARWEPCTLGLNCIGFLAWVDSAQRQDLYGVSDLRWLRAGGSLAIAIPALSKINFGFFSKINFGFFCGESKPVSNRSSSTSDSDAVNPSPSISAPDEFKPDPRIYDSGERRWIHILIPGRHVGVDGSNVQGLANGVRVHIKKRPDTSDDAVVISPGGGDPQGTWKWEYNPPDGVWELVDWSNRHGVLLIQLRQRADGPLQLLQGAPVPQYRLDSPCRGMESDSPATSTSSERNSDMSGPANAPHNDDKPGASQDDGGSEGQTQQGLLVEQCSLANASDSPLPVTSSPSLPVAHVTSTHSADMSAPSGNPPRSEDEQGWVLPERASQDSGESEGHCLLETSRVTLENGDSIWVGKVQQGMRLLARKYNGEDAIATVRSVRHFAAQQRQLVTVTMESPGKISGAFTATANHVLLASLAGKSIAVANAELWADGRFAHSLCLIVTSGAVVHSAGVINVAAHEKLAAVVELELEDDDHAIFASTGGPFVASFGATAAETQVLILEFTRSKFIHAALGRCPMLSALMAAIEKAGQSWKHASGAILLVAPHLLKDVQKAICFHRTDLRPHHVVVSARLLPFVLAAIKALPCNSKTKERVEKREKVPLKMFYAAQQYFSGSREGTECVLDGVEVRVTFLEYKSRQQNSSVTKSTTDGHLGSICNPRVRSCQQEKELQELRRRAVASEPAALQNAKP